MPKRKHYEDFWSEFEDTIANTGLISTIPSCIKELLTAVGYNSAFSLLTITEAKLTSVEEYIETNCRELADTFELYQSRKPFSFLPGHRDLIIGISSELTRLQDAKQPNKQLKRAKRNAQCNLNERDLRASLVNQLTTYATGLGLHQDWFNLIDDFVLETTENATYATCSVSCEICPTVTATRYDKHWKISNVFRHIRSHVKSNKNTTTTQKTTQVATQDDIADREHWETTHVDKGIGTADTENVDHQEFYIEEIQDETFQINENDGNIVDDIITYSPEC